jgi:signal peptidase I
MFIVIIINGFFFSIAKVDGDSMQPNFCNNDTVVITYNGEVATDDVLILENDDSFLIKRVIALPGDKLVVDDSGVYVNDTLVESFLLSNHFEYDGVIPSDFYFVLGDNRDNSLDSRVIGLIEADRILGEVIYHINTNTCN